MRKRNYKKYLLLGAVLFFLISLPTSFVEYTRGMTIGLLSGSLKSLCWAISSKTNEAERFESENHLLRIEVGKLKTLLDQQAKIVALQQEQKCYEPSSLRYEQIGFLLGLQNKAIPARVIYRDPGSWSSSLWVNVGEESNRLIDATIVAKNSPVIVGRSVVGVIDYVGKKQSRVRLVTDMALKPSVRAVRGSPQNNFLIEQIEPILRQLADRSDIPLTPQETKVLYAHLEKLKIKLADDHQGHYLAKGILQGGGTPLWRSVNRSLRGIGFNYDFADEEGPARELVTGKPVVPMQEDIILPIIQVHDLLVTTGIDGVFPPGLRVAEVTKIFPLKEGAYTYDIEALPVVRNLDTLQTLFIIPPLGNGYESCDCKRDGTP